MQETVAAAVLALTEWDGERPLYDPMCGSGTLLCEALMAYCRIPAGFLRSRFGFELLPDFSASAWEEVRRASDKQIRKLPEGLIQGSDRDSEAVEAARENLRALPMGESVGLSVLDWNRVSELGNRCIVSNPPYGLRIGKERAMPEFYRRLGDFLKQRCTGSTAYLYCGDRNLIGSIGLKTTFKKPLAHGGLDGRLIRLDMY